jgi:hypothetical protein
MSEQQEDPGIGVTERLLWVLVLLLPLTLFSGWVAKCLWLWFVVPLGAPELGLWHAAGLYLMARVVVLTGSTSSKNHPLHDALVGVLTTLVILGVCALIRLGV